MRIHVIYSVNEATHNDFFSCQNASRQMRGSGLANIIFRDGFGILHEQANDLRVKTVTYHNAWRILVYED